MRPLSKYWTRWELPGRPAKGSVRLVPGAGPHTQPRSMAVAATGPSVRSHAVRNAGSANWTWENTAGITWATAKTTTASKAIKGITDFGPGTLIFELRMLHSVKYQVLS